MGNFASNDFILNSKNKLTLKLYNHCQKAYNFSTNGIVAKLNYFCNQLPNLLHSILKCIQTAVG
jgi:hypothetical protein